MADGEFRPKDEIIPWHEVVDHTSEIQLRLKAGTLGDLLAESGRALAGIQLRDAARPAPGPWRPIEIHSRDRASLLADWLNELVFLAETERWFGTEFEIDHADEQCLRARARGVTMEVAPGVVKAATLHGLKIEDVPGELQGEVILDV
jgi:SHS2 domain-containing protein